MPPPIVRVPPSVLGPFRLVRALGQGGFAPVWLAEEIYGGEKLRDVALKLFILPARLQKNSPGADTWRTQVIHEARALCRVEHPNVVRFYSLHQDDDQGIVGLAMEFVPGHNLEDIASERGPLDESNVIEAGISVAWALAAVHQAGLVHRDVKPGNIVQSASGYKLIDFGIVVDAVRQEEEANADIPIVVGTPGYIAPECIWAGAAPTSVTDIYALGVTLHRLTTGKMPDVRGRIGNSRIAPGLNRGHQGGASAIESLTALIHLLLSPDPATRPRHADWVARELERIRAQSASPPLRIPTGETQPPPALALNRPRDTSSRKPGQSTTMPKESWLDPRLVGREAVLQEFADAARDAARGSVRIVLLTGPLGIGRSRLLHAAVEVAGISADRVLWLRCSPERKSPLKPLLRALEALPDGGDGAFAYLKDAIDRALAPNLLLGAKQGNEALEGVEDAIVEAARDVAVMVIVDDLQWGDAHTLGLMHMLVERASHGAAARLCVVAASRDEPNPSSPLKALLGQVQGKVCPRVQHIALGPLAAEQTAALGHAVCPMDAVVERALVRGSGGVPFFVVHALQAWRETGAIAWNQGAWQAVGHRLNEEDVPGVASLVEARIASYFDPGSAEFRAAFRAFAAIALYGGGIPVDMVFRVVGGDEASLERALEVVVDAGIIHVGGDRQEYSFAQEMVRQALLNLVRSRPWFHRLHRALLDNVAEAPSTADATFLAIGYEKLGLRTQARNWLQRAITTLIGSGLFIEAADLGDRLAGFAESLEERVDVELEVVRALVLGRTLQGIKERIARIEAMERMLPAKGTKAGTQQIKRRIYQLEATRWLHEVGEDQTLIADADALGEPVLSCKARLAIAGISRGAQAIALATEAIALAERLEPAIEFVARILRVDLIYAASSRDLALVEQDLRRALAIAVATSSMWQEILVEGDLAVLEAELGRVDDAIIRLQRSVKQAQTLGMREQHRLLSHNLSTCLMRANRAAEAAAAAQKTAELAGEAKDPMLRGVALSLRAHALCAIGNLDAALACATEAEQLQHERNDRMRAQTLLRRAEIFHALGKTDAAYADVRSARRVAEEHGERGFVVTAALWETLHLAQQGQATADDVRSAMADVERAGIGQRALTKSLLKQADTWLGLRTRPSP